MVHGVKPVKRAREPLYPAKDIIASHPELLRQLPVRWRGNLRTAFTAGFAASFAILAGCGQLPGDAPVPEPPLAGVPMPPAYASEADAVQIILDAANKEPGDNDESTSESANAQKQMEEFMQWLEAEGIQ